MNDAPLELFRIVGIEERTYQAAPGAPVQGAGTCWHCGAGIKTCVVATHLDSGEVITVGTTCAERIGLDPAGLKHYLAEKFADDRRSRRSAIWQARVARREQEELELEQTIGAHGSVERYGHGCRCDACRVVAPHGTSDCFWEQKCSCSECLSAALESDQRLHIAVRDGLVDISTGQVVEDARIVSGRYGLCWFLPETETFVRAYAKKRETIVKHGYTYVETEWLVRTWWNGQGESKERLIASPVVDIWGEAITPKAEGCDAEPVARVAGRKGFH